MYSCIRKILIIIVIAVFNIFLFTGCSEFERIKKNELIIDSIEDQNKLIIEGIQASITNEEAQEIGMKAFKDNFGINIDREIYKFYLKLINKEMNEKYLKYMDIDNYLNMRLDLDENLVDEYYRGSWYVIGSNNIRYFNLQFEIDAKTRKIMSLNYMKRDSHKKKEIVKEEAKVIATDYIKSVNEKKGSKLTLYKEREKVFSSRYSEFYFLFKEDNNTQNERLVVLNSYSEEVEGFSVGVKAVMDYYRGI